jgi:hypothetical protein
MPYPAVQPYYNFTIADDKGKIVRKSRKYKSYSFVKGFLDIMMLTFIETHSTCKNTANVSTTIGAGGYYNDQRVVKNTRPFIANSSYTPNGETDSTKCGIVIGSGNAAVNVSDFALQTPILNAAVAHSVQNMGACAVDSTSTFFNMTRVFTNVSGSDKFIREIGIVLSNCYYSQGGYTSYAYLDNILVIRDVLPGAITLTNGQSMTLNYTIKATV